jgi:sugar lactone lactonase YvrE
MLRAILISVVALVACARGPAAPTSPPDPLLARLEADLDKDPGNATLMYALAWRNDRLERVDDALRWLEAVATTSWDAGLDANDFPNSRARDAARFDAARAAIERKWTAVPTARELLRVGERDLLPEGVERHPQSGELLLSSGRKRKVVAVAPDGTTRDVVGPAQDGLLATLGLRVDGGRGLLWVASAAAPFMEQPDDVLDGSSRLHAFELATGRMRARFEVPGPSLLNDVVVLPDGRAAVTDSVTGTVWVTADARLEQLLPAKSLPAPNGIAVGAVDGLLYVGTFRGIFVVDWRARRAEPLRMPASSTSVPGIDGLYLHRGALVGIQNAVGHPRVVRLPLTADGRGAIRVDVIETGSPVVDNPTTGVVVGDDFVFLARRNREQPFESGTPPPREALEDIVLATVALPSA